MDYDLEHVYDRSPEIQGSIQNLQLERALCGNIEVRQTVL